MSENIYFQKIIINKSPKISFGLFCKISKIIESVKNHKIFHKKISVIALLETIYQSTPKIKMGNKNPNKILKTLFDLISESIVENNTQKIGIITEKNHNIISLFSCKKLCHQEISPHFHPISHNLICKLKTRNNKKPSIIQK